jgi:hypothetical protein
VGQPVTAQADTVLYDSANFVVGQQSFVEAFTVTKAGTLTISLANIPWLDTVKDLSCFLSSATGVIGKPMGAGVDTMLIGPGTYYLHWFGDADGAYKVGVERTKIEFEDGVRTAVALPSSVIFLLSGLGLLWGWQREALPDLQTV